MRLVLQLVARLLVVVGLCLGAATIWATIDAYRSVDRATAASAQRVSQTLEALYWRELLLRSNRTREHLLPVPEWRTIETMKLISPGICVEFEPKGAFEAPLCGQSKGIGKPAPLWFAAAVQGFLGSHAAVSRPISVRAITAGAVSAIADPDADRAGLGTHSGHHNRRVADGDSNRGPRLARNRSHPRARTIYRCRTATDGARSIPDISPAVPIHGACHDRTGRLRSRSPS